VAGRSAPAIQRARTELERARLWKARDRLTGYLARAPADQEALELLGEIHYRMGDLPAAARCWFLTERSDEAAAEARAAAREVWPTSGAFAAVLRARADFDAWPPAVAERLRALQRDARAEGYEWTPRPLRATDAPEAAPARGGRMADAALEALGVLFLVALVGPWLLGAGVAVYLLLRAVGAV
jgi:hypothetical protein